MKVKLDSQASCNRVMSCDAEVFFRERVPGTRVQACRQKQVIFSQGDSAASLFYILRGRVRLTMFSRRGKAATIAILGDCDFLGEECLGDGPAFRRASAIAVSDCSLVQIKKESMISALDHDPAMAGFFMEYLLARKIRVEEDLADQLFHSSERRLVRVLLMLAATGHNGATGRDLPEINQEILAEMVGTTRPRISYFMNKFRKLGLIDYSSGLHVKKELEIMLQ